MKNPVLLPPISVTVDALSCVRGGRPIFDGLSFKVGAGQVLELRGPNGAGKSSLLRILAGLLEPANGTVHIDGASEDMVSIHFLGHLDGLKSALTLRENLHFWQVVYGLSSDSLDLFLARHSTRRCSSKCRLVDKIVQMGIICKPGGSRVPADREADVRWAIEDVSPGKGADAR